MPETNDSNRRTLYKNPDQAKLCGVCAGVADYLGFEVWLVRIVAISLLLLSKFSAMVILPYFVLCLVLDPKPGSKSNRGCFGRQQTKQQQTEPKQNSSSPYKSSVKDVWRDSSSPSELLQEIENKFSNLETKLQSMESFVTSKEYNLEKEFREMG
jgi:phage shock protein C